MFDLDSPNFLGLCNRVFHPGTRAKGEWLFKENKVSHCDLTNEGAHCEARAKVQGAAPQPYEVTFSCWQQSKSSVVFNARCTCPLIENCKHIYAVILAARETPAQAPNPQPSARDLRLLPLALRPAPPPPPPPAQQQ